MPDRKYQIVSSYQNCVTLTLVTNTCQNLSEDAQNVSEQMSTYFTDHVKGRSEQKSPLSLSGTLTCVISGAAHCADMYPPTVLDPPDLQPARNRISAHIGKWIQN